ncbi:TIGR02928, orc1/cdc6 family replication initiation protein [Comamonadaceae bacterium]
MRNNTVHDVTRKLRGCFAQFPQVQTVLYRLDLLINQEYVNAEPDHLLLMGESGVGKSRIFEHFVSLHPRSETAEHTVIPVLYAETPNDCTPKKLATELLRAMGSPLWNKGNEQELTHQLLVLLKACQTRMVLLDEANHLVERGGAKSHYQLGDWVKLTARQARIPFVFGGTERTRELLNVNEQLRSRFRETIRLQPFTLATEEDALRTRSALKVFESLMGEIDRINISDEALASKMIFATHGRLREIRKLLVRWAEIGYRKKTPSLTLKDLAQAFSEVIFPDAPKQRNPFLADFNGLALSLSGEPYAPAAR